MNQKETIEILKSLNPRKFFKFGEFAFRIAKEEQLVETWIGDELETRNTAFIGDVIMVGPRGEEFVLKPEKFKQRYEIKHFIPSGEFEHAGKA